MVLRTGTPSREAQIRKRHAVHAVVALLLVGAVVHGTAAAATLTVSNTANGGPGSLRKAIAKANGNGPDADRIVVKTNGTVRLGKALPGLATDMRVKAPGADRFAVRRDAEADFRIFTVGPGATVRISGLTARNGSAEQGAGILNQGVLTLKQVEITRNIGHAVAAASGAGIYNSGTLSVDRSAVTRNEFVFEGPCAPPGLARRGSSECQPDGGAIVTVGPDLTITRSTIALNGEITGPGPTASTTALRYGGGSLALIGVTLADNAGYQLGASGFPGPLTARNTIISDAGSPAPLDRTCQGRIGSLGHNFTNDTLDQSEMSSCGFDQATDQAGADPALKPLGDYGGRTRTMALPKASLAVDKGVAAAHTTDQRGKPRIFDVPAIVNAVGGDGADVGAFERQGG